MRIAILADIHANPIALDAVLSDIEKRGGVDGYWCLGDYSAIGFDPVTVLERLTQLPNTTFIRGNVDRFVVTGELPEPSLDNVKANTELLPVFREVAGSFGWAQGYLKAHGWIDWLAELPLEHRLTLPDGTRVLLVHAAPGEDDGDGLNNSLTDDGLRQVMNGCDADLVCVGHFHMAMDRHIKDIHIMNPGSVSNQFPPDLRAAYAILTATEDGYHITYHRVAYDLQQSIERAKQSMNPGAPYVIAFYEGKIRAKWLKKWDGISHYPNINL